jgi:hypothetical protein
VDRLGKLLQRHPRVDCVRLGLGEHPPVIGEDAIGWDAEVRRRFAGLGLDHVADVH